MRLIPTRLRQGLRLLAGRGRLDADLERELTFHLEMEIAQRVAGGMTPAEARRTALVDFGGLARSTEEVRDVRGVTFWDNLVQDVRYGLRALRRSPGYTAAAVVTLGLGIGANTAIFSVVNGVLLHPLPYRASGQLVRLEENRPLVAERDIGVSIPEVWDFRQRLTTVDSVVEYHQMSFVLLDHGKASRVLTGVVSSGYFDTLGVRPLFGRTFRLSDDLLGAEPVLILSNTYWLKQFGGDSHIVGRQVEMNDRVHTVVGVLPPIPGYPANDDVYMPTSACPYRANAERRVATDRRTFSGLTTFARLKAGVTLAEAAADVAAVGQAFASTRPDVYQPTVTGFQATTVPLDREITQNVRPVVWVLLATTGLVLLIACANVANLSLSRTLGRERELGLRTALGARRTRLVRQLFTENALVALAGGALGLVLAWATKGLLGAFVALFTSQVVRPAIDGQVLLFTLAVSLATGLTFGLLPVLVSGLGVSAAVRDGMGPCPTPTRGFRLRSTLVVAQVALGFALVTGAGLLLHSFWQLSTANLGYVHPDGVVAAEICCNFNHQNQPGSAPDAALPLYEAILAQAQATSGVTRAAITNAVPLSGIERGGVGVHVAGAPVVSYLEAPRVDTRVVSDDYFALLGIPILEGRGFLASDTRQAPNVVVINQSMRRLWGSRDPVGTTLTAGPPPSDGQPDLPYTVVGVVGDVRQFSIDDPAGPVLYQPLEQANTGFFARLLLRTAGDPATLIPTVRGIVQAVSPDVPVEHVRTLEDLREAQLASPRIGAALLTVFAGLALLIALGGLGAVLATSVSQRTRELGVRLALGASHRSVLTMVLRQAVGLLGLGLTLGVSVALTFGHLLAGYLYETTVTDPVVYVVVALVFLVTGLLASFGPARRAVTIDPLVALRCE